MPLSGKGLSGVKNLIPESAYKHYACGDCIFNASLNSIKPLKKWLILIAKILLSISTLLSAKILRSKKNARTTVENFEKVKSLADFYLK